MSQDKSLEKDPIILIDGSSYLYRAYHAMPPLTSSKGQPTGAIKGVINMIKKILTDHPASPIAVIFDAKGKNFRHEMYSEYKANRPPMPEDLVLQINPLHEIIQAMGIKILVIEGVEADDVIGTLADQAKNSKKDTVISSGDKDMTQLVCKNVVVVNTMKDELLDEKGVKNKFGVRPDQIIDYLALVGDTSDNVPGVDKVGPKTAVKWINEYNDLDCIINNSEKIEGKVGENLRSGISQLKLSKELVTIKTDVNLDIGINDLRVQKPDNNTLQKIFSELEFKVWLDEKNNAGLNYSNSKNSTNEYELIVEEKKLDQWINKLSKYKVIALDTETSGLDYTTASLVGISLSGEKGSAIYIPFGHTVDSAPLQLDRDLVINKLKPLINSKKIIGQNIKFDMNILSRYGLEINGIENDTMLMSYIYNSTASRHNLDALSGLYLQHKTITFEEIAGKGVKQKTFGEIPIEKAKTYAAEDADITLRLYKKLKSKLKKEPALNNLLEEIELPLVPVLSDMELTGTNLNSKILDAQSKDLAKRIEVLSHKAFEMAGEEFNLGSPKQLQEIFYEKLKYPVKQKTPGGQPSTAENVLQLLAEDFELPKVILEHRSLNKLKQTYTDKLPLQISKSTNRVHTSYHQAVTTTGRLSSSDPNLQNIPIKTEDGRRIRQAFEAPNGFSLVSADYSQIELRIMAHMSKDQNLIGAFKNGEDIHTSTASEVFGSKLDKVTSDQRRSAKAINFGLIYGISAFGLGKQLGINRNLASDYIETYFSRYPGVREYMEETKNKAKEKGFVETLYNRRLYVPEINGNNGMRRKAAERAAINAPVQGTAADIMKLAMIKLYQWLETSNLDAKIIMQVHDELVLEVKESDIKETSDGLINSMKNAADLTVPLDVEIGVGSNWDQAH
ncbi:MAG: DNA polymerase I [SAR86 cluster bacterium]|nr:DNA polymerase I [SAR86 cluster bacterium]